MASFFAKYKIYIFVAIGVAFAAGAAWWSLTEETPSASVLTTQGDTGVATGDKDLVDTLLQLRAVSLSGAIFSDPSFVTLRDFGTQIVPEAVGRPNPFAPFTTYSTSTANTGAEPFAPQR